MVWYNYRRVPAVTLRQAADRRGQAGPHLPLPRANSCRTGRSPRDLPQGGEGLWRLDVERRRQRRHRRSARALHRHRAVAERTDRRSDRDDGDVHQGAQAHADGQGGAGRHRRRQRVPGPVPQRLARDVRSDALRARPQGALHAGDQRRARLDRAGTCTTCTACSGSTIATRASLRGWRSVHITDGDHPYMKHWWVPGLQIGYEHTFIHQFADFLEGVATGKPASPTFRDGSRDRLRDGCGAEVGEDIDGGKQCRVRRRQRDIRERRSRSTSRSSAYRALLVKNCPVSIVFDNTPAPGRGTVRPT